MKIYIAHFFTEYSTTDEKYAYASAHKTRAEAEQALREEMIRHLDANGIDEDEDTTAEQEIERAFENGGEEHDAILEYFDTICYLDITETNV